MAMSDNSKKVLNYLKEIHGTDVTAKDVAEALDLDTKQVNGIFTSAIQKKGFGHRVPAQVLGEDGAYVNVKFLVLDAEGLAFDPDAIEE